MTEESKDCSASKCSNPATTTVRMNSSGHPYWEDKPVCAEHARLLRLMGWTNDGV